MVRDQATTGTRWQEWASFALGLWLAVSPWVAGYSDHGAATANAALAGLALAFASHLEVCFDAAKAEWLNLAVGLWLMGAPFVLELGPRRAAVTSIAVGITVTALAASAMSLGTQAGRRQGRQLAEH